MLFIHLSLSFFIPFIYFHNFIVVLQSFVPFYFILRHSTLPYSTPNQCSGSKHGDSNKSKSSSADDTKALRKEMAEHKERADGYLVQLQDGAKYVQTMREQLEEVRTNIQLHIIISITSPLSCCTFLSVLSCIKFVFPIIVLFYFQNVRYLELFLIISSLISVSKIMTLDL